MAASTAIDLDVFHEMALAREAFARHALPCSDSFAFTPTLPVVVHHEWGTGVVLFVTWIMCGPAGLALLRYALVAGVVVTSYFVARRRGATAPAMIIAAPLAVSLFALGLAPVRAQLFTMLFLSIELYLLDIDRRGGRRWIAAWVPLQIAWVNLHGGVVIGIAVMAVATLERIIEWRGRAGSPRAGAPSHLVLLCVFNVGALLVNPFGASLIEYLWRALRMKRPLIDEWAPIWDPRVPGAHVALLSMVFVLFLYALWRNARWFSGATTTALFCAAAASSQRHLPLLGIVWFASTAPALSSTPLVEMVSRWVRSRVAAAAVAIAVCAHGIWLTVAMRSWELTIPSRPGRGQVYPVKAVTYLERIRFEGNLWTRFEDGSYVTWRLYPAVKISLDSRYEVAFPDRVFIDHIRFFSGVPNSIGLPARYGATALLIPNESPAAREVDQHPSEWQRVYRDDEYAVYLPPGAGQTTQR